MRFHSKLVLGIGELLWDVVDGKAHLGGAPANFAVMAGQLGDRAVILSRIGRDERGREAIDALESKPADASLVQIDTEHPTGLVTVALHEGQPTFTIHEPSAWDFLELTDEWVQLAERADAICFGSLAQRGPEARQTIQTLLSQARGNCARIFDVNLRAPFYSSEVLQESLELATILKLNDAEMEPVLDLLGLPMEGGSAHQQQLGTARRLLDEFPTLNMVALTRGGKGSMLVTRQEFHDHPGVRVQVADTIGAGDAYTAALAHYWMRGADLATMNEAGNRWGSWVASQHGAMPELPDATRTAMEAEIGALAAAAC